MLLFVTTNMAALTSRANHHATSTEIHNLQPVFLLRIKVTKGRLGSQAFLAASRNWE